MNKIKLKVFSALNKINFYLHGLLLPRSIVQWRNLSLIRSSGLFVEEWYLLNNPDVAKTDVDPALHYLLKGGFNGRDPSPKFHSQLYLDYYADVRLSGINPLIHYLTYGQKEGRDKGYDEGGEAELFTLGRTYDYSKQVGSLVFENTPERIYLQRPRVIGSFSRTLEEGDAFCPLPYISVFENAFVFGGSNLVIVNSKNVLSDDMVDYPGKEFGIKSPFIKYRDGNKVLLEYKRDLGTPIEEGILLSCEHDNNYFHWLVECLPKLLWIDEIEQFRDMPLLIQKDLHKNLMEALRRVSSRRLIQLETNVAYHVKRLVYPSALSRVIDRYQGDPVFDSDIVLSHKWVSRVPLALKHGKLFTRKPWRKLYLTRKKGGLRALGNRDEIEFLMYQRGFEIIDLENFSLDLQIELFSEAALIVAPTGAALTNMMFCQPGTKIVVFMSNHEVTNYYLWSMMGDIFGLDITTIAGDRLFTLTDYWSVHDDYLIDSRALLNEIRQHTREEIGQAGIRLAYRFTQILKAPDDPLNIIGNLEMEALKFGMNQAWLERDPTQLQTFNSILVNAFKAELPNRLPDGRLVVDRVGFMIHTAEMFNHYRNIFQNLDKDRFAVILYDEPTSILAPLLNELNISYVFMQDVILKKIVFKYLVSNHIIAEGVNKEWIIQEVGLKNIRFMYALGKSRWNFSDWNCVYDLILCFGPYQVEKLDFCKNTKKMQIGYPRYDAFFSGQIDRGDWLRKLNCDPSKKTILWLPTKGELCTIGNFAESIAKLKDHYNVVVKPHPLALVEDVQDIELLRRQNFNALVDELVDNTNLFYIADFVFSDYGGTAFGALYTDRNLLLLNMPNPEDDPLTGVDSADIMLRQYIVNINPQDGVNLQTILEDTKVWEQQKQARAQLCKIYFAPYYGNAAEVTVGILENLDEVLGN